MVARAKWVLNVLAALLFSVSVASAQYYAQEQGRRAFAQQELDQMLAPIALYPDALLSQILMAATYPGEVVEAARWSRVNPGLNGDRAVRAVERVDWDPAVKSLVAFPQILGMLDEKIGWTQDLGDAFLEQQAQVMDTVQYLRRKAYAAGNLQSSDQFRVDIRDSSFVIEFANPEIVYLPYYNPLVVFGTWWWTAYQPVYWAPWPGYYARAGYARGYAWGPGIAVARGFFYCTPDWQRRNVTIVNVNNYYYRPANMNRPPDFARGVESARSAVWQHDTAHRREVQYRDPSWRQSTATARAAPAPQRDWRERDATARPAVTAVAPAPETRSAAGRPQAASAPDSVTRSAPARGPATRGNDTPAAGERSGYGQRDAARADAGGRFQQRDSAQPVIAGVAARPAVERAPVSVPAPAQPAEVRNAPTQPNGHGVVSGTHAQQADAAHAASAPAGAAYRADTPNAKAREHAGTASSGNATAAASAPGNSPARQ